MNNPTVPPTDASRPTPLAEQLVDALLTELRTERSNIREQHSELVRERRTERRWKLGFQILFFGGPVFMGLIYLFFFTSALGFQWGPFGEVVGVVRIEGVIAPNGRASAKHVVALLEKAFTYRNVKAVVLSIDSPGGAAVEAERISDAIKAFKKKHPKPVVAVINNVGASAAYMIAMHSDFVYAAKFSLVGSIGTMIEGWDAHRALERLDLAQRVYASGRLKSMLSPFLPMSKEAVEKAMQLVQQGGRLFVDELKQARGSRLKSGVDYGTGEVWSGEEALSLGLVDQIGTLDEIITANWGVKSYDFGSSQEGFGSLTSIFQGFSQSLTENIAARLGPQMR
jgi:protease IV